jgi:hypothetical protein
LNDPLAETMIKALYLRLIAQPLDNFC